MHSKVFKFSFLKYWLVLISMATFLLWQVFLNDFIGSLKLFIVFGITGIVGETLVSIWWHYFFNKSFWVYLEATIYHKYTSFLNFIPWGIGGFIYLYITKLVMGDIHSYFPELEVKLIGVFLICIVTQIIIFKNFFKNRKFHELNTKNSILFYFPIFFTFITVWQIGGNQMLWLIVVYGIIATILEYLFGKFIQSLFEKKLWTYSYAALDYGHFTPLAIPLFAMGGLYFWIITRIIG